MKNPSALEGFPEKPPYGGPCNSCGVCCATVLCPLGKHVFGREEGPCPALGFDARKPKTLICGLASAPGNFVPHLTMLYGHDVMKGAAMVLIGAGSGCDSQLEHEPPNPEYSAKLTADCEAQSHLIKLAAKLWRLQPKDVTI